MSRVVPTLLALCTWCIWLCSTDPAVAEQTAQQRDQVERVTKHYAELVYAVYADSLAGVKRLNHAIDDFLAQPTEERLAKCREAWIAARVPYGQSEVFRFYSGPIDSATGPEARINSWPIDEAWLESGQPDQPGIVEDVKGLPRIGPAELKARNQVEGEKNISCGWHAIEFMLWGQDLSPTGPGNRPVTDYTKGPFAKRRAAVLRAAGVLLEQDLESVAREWKAGEKNYREGFTDPNSARTSLAHILTGMFYLPSHEMAGERMGVALETKDQENEQSCFSDTTHLDFLNNLAGIRAVWTGKYEARFVPGGSVEGAGVRELAAALAPEFAKDIDTAFVQTERKLQLIPVPFDQAIRGADDDAPGRRAVFESLRQIEGLAARFKQLAKQLSVELERQDASPAG